MLLESLSCELQLTGQTEEALVAQHDLLELSREIDDPIAAGRSLRWISRVSWMLGRNADSERYAAMAVEDLRGTGSVHDLAMAYSNMAQLRMLADDMPAHGTGETSRWSSRRVEKGDASGPTR